MAEPKGGSAVIILWVHVRTSSAYGADELTSADRGRDAALSSQTGIVRWKKRLLATAVQTPTFLGFSAYLSEGLFIVKR